MVKELIIKEGFHREKPQLFLQFEYDSTLIYLIKNKVNASWSQTHSTWYMANDSKLIEKLSMELEPLGVSLHIPEQFTKTEKPLAKLNQEGIEKISQLKNWMRSKRYSDSTINTYTDALTLFLRFMTNKQISQITNDDIISFNNEYILAKHLSGSFQNQVVNAIKLLLKITENKGVKVENIHRPKRARILPNVFSKEEIRLILSSPTNLKHRAMLSLIYSCGLRRGELLNLKLTDIDSKRNLIIVRQAKGKKDRIVPLSEKVTVILREYYLAFKPKTWLFEGQTNDKYSEESLAKVFKNALYKANIQKPATLHWLRHSYATHLLENGTDLRYIQEILGHRSSKTTEIYTHVSTKSIQNVKSPFDDL